jgi:hypothetical protein
VLLVRLCLDLLRLRLQPVAAAVADTFTYGVVVLPTLARAT